VWNSRRSCTTSSPRTSSDSYPTVLADVSITLFEAGDALLNTFDAALSDYTIKIFQRQKISVRLQSQVAKVEANEILLKDGSRVPYGMMVWSTGNTQTDFVKSLPFEKDSGSRLLTDEFFHLKGYQAHLFPGGLCNDRRESAAGNVAGGAAGGILPCSDRSTRSPRNRPVEPFIYHHRGMLAYIGSNRALADLPQVKGTRFLHVDLLALRLPDETGQLEEQDSCCI
jgi:NADH:ubiquinone reductase (non-electrogenic)